MSEEQFVEEVNNPGFKFDWDNDQLQPEWFGIYPALERLFLPRQWQFRPRYAAALAMLRRRTNTFVHLNLPSMYDKDFGWMSWNVVLGKEEEWKDPPTREEALTAYLIQSQIALLTGFGTPAIFSGTMRQAVYAGVNDKIDLESRRRQWDRLDLGRVVKPYDLETAALTAAAATLRAEDLRRWLGVGFLTLNGPLAWTRTPDKSVFPHWN